MVKLVLFAGLVGFASAFVAAPPKPFAVRQSSQLHESFGFKDLAEDTYDNQPDFLKGEAEYKQWMNVIDEDNMLNRKYNALGRVRELDLLRKTADSGILSKLEDNGVDLETIESLLPLLDQYGAVGVVGNLQQLLINGLAPLLIEGAPFLLPVVAGALGVGPPAFFLAAAVTGGLEVFLVVNDVELLNLPLGLYLGLILVPLTAVFAAVGVAFNGLKSKK